jgi:hypothetical protein
MREINKWQESENKVLMVTFSPKRDAASVPFSLRPLICDVALNCFRVEIEEGHHVARKREIK